MLHEHDNIVMDSWIHDKFLKIHMIRVYDTRVGYVSDTTRLHDRNIRATKRVISLKTVFSSGFLYNSLRGTMSDDFLVASTSLH